METLTACTGMHGILPARVAVALMDGVRESALESESFAFFVERWLPLPTCQVWLGDDRVDFLRCEAQLVDEADGKVKYADERGPDNGDGDALWREKGRSLRLERDHDVEVIRWTYADLRRTTSSTGKPAPTSARRHCTIIPPHYTATGRTNRDNSGRDRVATV